MGLKEWLIPQEKVFFGLFEAMSGTLVAGAEAMQSLVKDYRDLPRRVKGLKEIEHQGDELVHEIFEALNRTFVTPFDREDIAALARGLDNVLDMTYAAALRFELYEVDRATPHTVRFADITVGQCRLLQEGVALIRNMRNADRIEAIAVEVNRLENEADEVLHGAVAELFRTHDAVQIVKLKDIYEMMERATDYCEDVSDVLSDIAAKYR